MKRIVLDGKKMTSRKQAHLYIGEKAGFPEYYGCNLDALADCLSEIGEKTKFVIKNAAEMEENLGPMSKGIIRVFEDSEESNPNVIFEMKN